jgi:hypothetical protein
MKEKHSDEMWRTLVRVKCLEYGVWIHKKSFVSCDYYFR